MRPMIWRTVLPAFLAILLFSGVVFLYLLPSLDRVVMDQKRLMIRELTESAWNILARFEAEENQGRLDRQEAQAQAIAQIRSLHYGQQNKDYFWVIDQHPRMVVHPYRPDLEGTDLTDFRDPAGKRLFVEMVQVVARDGAGYVHYRWQWKDDAERIVPKLSYVQGFEPWGWILGTGVYTRDVDREIADMKGNLQTSALLILLVISVLLFTLLRASWQAEGGRLRATASLQLSEEKYRSLVESAGEAIIMDLAGEKLYANARLQHLLGYQSEEFAHLKVENIIKPTAEEVQQDRRWWEDIALGKAPPTRYEAEMAHRDGHLLRVMLTISRIVVQERAGFMAVATRLSQPRELDLATATTLDDLEAASRRTRDLAVLMVNHGSDAGRVSQMLSDAADTLVQRAVAMITEEMGPAPVPFDFLLMGSLGRREVTLFADQDHAIIHADPSPEKADEVSSYFLKMGRRMADLMAGSGFPYCAGGIMACEPACCQSLQAWLRTFDGWINTMEPDDFLQAKIFFDFRGLFGSHGLAADLDRHLRRSVISQPRFLPLLAHSILHFEPPLSTTGRFVVQDAGDGRLTLDIKGVQAQCVDLGRLKALQHSITAVGTEDRFLALRDGGHLHPDTVSQTLESFRLLRRYRLEHQARQRAQHLEPDNLLDPETLSDDGRARLKNAFRQIKVLQSALEHEFGSPK